MIYSGCHVQKIQKHVPYYPGVAGSRELWQATHFACGGHHKNRGGQHEVCMGYTCVAQVATLVWPFCLVLLIFGPFSFLYLIRSLFICLNKIPGISNYL
jgi:hypothetical protein